MMSNHEMIKTFEPRKTTGQVKMPDFHPKMMELLMGHRADPVSPAQRVTHIPNASITFTTTTEEVRSVDPDTGAEKGTKLARYDLIPVGPLRKLAEHYGKGAEKYADHNWRKGYDWSKSYAALQRHANEFWGGEDMDAELRSNHMAAVAFHAFVLLEYCETMRDKDDRWTTMVARGEDDG